MGLTIPAGSSLNCCQELLTIDGDSPWEVFQAEGIGGEVTETQCLCIWTANNNGRQLDIAEQTKLPPNIALIRYIIRTYIHRQTDIHLATRVAFSTAVTTLGSIHAKNLHRIHAKNLHRIHAKNLHRIHAKNLHRIHAKNLHRIHAKNLHRIHAKNLHRIHAKNLHRIHAKNLHT